LDLARQEPGDVMGLSHDPRGEIAYAVKCAKALGEVMEQKPKKVIINGKRYLEIDDWTMLGHFFGLSPTVEWTRPVDFGSARGWEARASVIHRSSGKEISAGEAMCLNDEERWSTRPKYEKGKKVGLEPVPMNQLRSMAQTRAQSKALAGALRWVAQLGGFQGTPAEEMDENTGEPETPTPQPRPAEGAPEPRAADAPPPTTTPGLVTVQGLKTLSSGTNARGDWTMTGVLVSGGAKYVVFDNDVAAELAKAKKDGANVRLTLEPPRKEGGDPVIVDVARP
jgi:hypothetical protein